MKLSKKNENIRLDKVKTRTFCRYFKYICDSRHFGIDDGSMYQAILNDVDFNRLRIVFPDDSNPYSINFAKNRERLKAEVARIESITNENERSQEYQKLRGQVSLGAVPEGVAKGGDTNYY